LQVLLGLFICWQILFLIANNATRFLVSAMASRGDVPQAVIAPVAAVKDVTEGWVQLTGQRQEWSLFAPSPPVRALFLNVECESRREPRRLQLSFEPRIPGDYWHSPGVGDRLWHIEKSLAWPFVAWEPTQVAQRGDEWRRYLEERVQGNWRAYRAYLAWRQRQFREEHPREPPCDALVLDVSIYTPSAGPEQPPRQDVRVPFLRWRPGSEPPADRLPLEIHERGGWRFVDRPARVEVAP
jgi:hypothetical protein